jgi:PAS domain S-box-containing protein
MRAQDHEMGALSAELVADLETAYEELRVADEEVRSQQEQIARLLERQNTLHWQHERMLSMLPVPALVTDSEGVIRSVNAAAAAAMSIRVARMLGKPIFGLFDASDRRQLREMLVGAGMPGTQRRVATLVPRTGERVPVEVTLTTREDGAEVSWLLLTSRGEQPIPASLPEVMSRLSALPSHDRNLQDVLVKAVSLCRQTLDPPCEVSISIGPPDEPAAISATSQRAQAIDGAQWEAGEGPRVTAFEQRELVVSSDLRQDPRWPALALRIPEGVVSAVAAPIEVGDRVVGTLSVFTDHAREADAVRETLELLAATLGAVVYELELGEELDRLGEDMKRALSSRAVIEQAKGIVMAQLRCTPEQAFAHLAELSSARELKLREVARLVVEQAQG